MVARSDSVIAMVGTAPWPLTLQTAKRLTGLDVGGGTLSTAYWSRDGRWLSGGIQLPSGEIRGNAIYEVETGRIRQLSDDAMSSDLAWLPGYRRVVYFTLSGTLVVQDIESLERHVISAALPYPPDQNASIVAARDGRTLFYGARQVESNIWLVKKTAAGGTP